MTDLPAQPDIWALIMDADEPTWRKVKKVLAVKTRPEAVEVVQTDPQAAELVMGLLTESLVTRESEGSRVTVGRTERPDTAELMYGKKRKGVSI